MKDAQDLYTIATQSMVHGGEPVHGFVSYLSTMRYVQKVKSKCLETFVVISHFCSIQAYDP